MPKKENLILKDEFIESNKSKIDSESWENYKNLRCQYTCFRCGNRVGLSFIEHKHSCSNPMFNKSGEKINYNRDKVEET